MLKNIIEFTTNITLRRYQELFVSLNRSLYDALDRATTQFKEHMTSKGDVCENAVRKFLGETLGSRYAVGQGQIFDSMGNQSKQQDIIIYDDYWSRKFTPKDSAEPALIPVESVYATIEVKKTLSSEKMRDAVQNIQSFKSLKRDKTGYDYISPQIRCDSFKESNYKKPGNLGYRNPYFSAVFVFESEAKIESVLETLKDTANRLPSSAWPDVVLIHNKGLILPFCLKCLTSGTHIENVATDGCEPSYIVDKLPNQFSLLGFYLLLMSHLQNTILRPMDYNKMYNQLSSFSRLIGNVEKSRGQAIPNEALEEFWTLVHSGS